MIIHATPRPSPDSGSSSKFVISEFMQQDLRTLTDFVQYELISSFRLPYFDVRYGLKCPQPLDLECLLESHRASNNYRDRKLFQDYTYGRNSNWDSMYELSWLSQLHLIIGWGGSNYICRQWKYTLPVFRNILSSEYLLHKFSSEAPT